MEWIIRNLLSQRVDRFGGLAALKPFPICEQLVFMQLGPRFDEATLAGRQPPAFFFVGKRGFAVLSAGWVALVFYNFLFPWASPLSPVFSTRVAEFFMLMCTVFYLDTYGHMPHYWSVLNYGPICTVFITTGALWDRWRQPRYPRWIMVLGDASYAIYLIHYVERYAPHYVIDHYVLPVPALSAHAETIICVGIAMLAFTGVLFHWRIERPTVRWLHARMGV